MNVSFYWSYFEERLNHIVFSVVIFKMSYSLPTAFFLVILLILGYVQYAKRRYKVLKKERSYWTNAEKEWKLSQCKSGVCVCVCVCVCKGLYFVVSSTGVLRVVTPVKGGSSCLMCVKSQLLKSSSLSRKLHCFHEGRRWIQS